MIALSAPQQVRGLRSLLSYSTTPPQSSVVSGQLSAVGCQLSVVSGQSSVVSGPFALLQHSAILPRRVSFRGRRIHPFDAEEKNLEGPSHYRDAARPGGRNQNGLLRVLRPFKASTQRPRRISVTSVLSFSWSRRTRKGYRSEQKSSRADKKFGASSLGGRSGKQRLPPSAFRLLLTTHCLLPTCLLPTAYRVLLTAYCLSPAPSPQSPEWGNNTVS